MSGTDATVAVAGRDARRTRQIARETLRLLAERRLPPTPEHYERTWREVAGAGPAEAGADGLPSVSKPWGELLSQALRVGVVPQLEEAPALQAEARALASAASSLAATAATYEDVQSLAARLHRFWEDVTAANLDADEIRKGLMRVLKLLVGNIAELLSDDSWVRGQLALIGAATATDIDRATLREIEKRLREIAFQQGVLRQGLDQAKDAMRAMVATFIERLATLADGTGSFQARLDAHATRIQQAHSLADLSTLVVELMEDTRDVAGAIGRSRDELIAAQRTVHEHEARARALETELGRVSSRLDEDYLTQVLNRRGLQRTFGAESARADRDERPMCVAILDIDHFKALNDRLGHAAGDDALVHLAQVVRESIRPSDSLGRWGGEEFVILLPQTRPHEAVLAMQRVQRALTRRYFLHNRERILITFSAGVAQRRPHESQAEVIERADRALYRAKQAGRNRVHLDEADAGEAASSGTTPAIPAPARTA